MNKVEALLEEYRDKLNRHKLPGIAVIWKDALTANKYDSGFIVYIRNIADLLGKTDEETDEIVEYWTKKYHIDFFCSSFFD